MCTRVIARAEKKIDDNGARNGKSERGIVESWLNEKQYGFIIVSEGDRIFCGHRNIEDGNRLVPGARVRFQLKYDTRKNQYSAENVTGGTFARPGP